MENADIVQVTQEDGEVDIEVNTPSTPTADQQSTTKKGSTGKRKRTNKHKIRNRNDNISNTEGKSDVLLDILDDVNAKSKVAKQRNSARSHFNHFLKLRNEELFAQGKPVGKSKWDDLTFEDFDKGNYIGEFSNYLGQIARLYKNPANELISYGSATGYMGSIKNAILDKFHKEGVPSQLKAEVWKRKLVRVQSMKINQAKKRNVPVFGSKESASDADRIGILAVCIWSGNVINAEFMNFFQSMVMNCGRGSEIGTAKIDHLSLREIEEENGYKYKTLQQYVNRNKTEGKFKLYEIIFFS